MTTKPPIAESSHRSAVFGQSCSSGPPPDREEVYSYHSVSRLAVTSVAFGVLSILTVFHVSLFVIPLSGAILAWIALVRVSELPDELTGRRVAWTGLGLSVALSFVGGGAVVVSMLREVPHGYRPIAFEDLQPAEDSKDELIPKLAFDIQDKNEKIFIKGYIYPGSQVTGIKRFVLVPSLAHCSFCQRDLMSTEMILVTLAGDLTTDYRADRVKLGGKLTVDSTEVTKPFGGFPYRLKADYVR